MSQNSCSSKKTQAACEAKGLLAKIANCRWSETFCHHASAFSRSNSKSTPLPSTTTTTPTSPRPKLTTSTKKPNPSDCEVPACQTKTSAFARLIRKPNGKKQQAKTSTSTTSETTTTTAATTTTTTSVPNSKSFALAGQCPAGREDLGWQSWTLLHSIAAYYPDDPTSEDQIRAKQFMNAFGYLYPCSHCAEAYCEDKKDLPIRVETRKLFSVWMCQMHNRVNVKLNKTVFDCNIDLLDARWRRNKHCEIDLEEGEDDASTSLGRM